MVACPWQLEVSLLIKHEDSDAALPLSDVALLLIFSVLS
jgi:hypothetical protein